MGFEASKLAGVPILRSLMLKECRVGQGRNRKVASPRKTEPASACQLYLGLGVVLAKLEVKHRSKASVFKIALLTDWL